MMLSTDAMADVVEILEADDFYRSAHGRIYAALRTLFAHGEPVDIDHRGRGAASARASSTTSAARCTCATSSSRCPRRPAPSHYARIVADAALRRRLIGAAADIMDMAYVGAGDADGIADDAEQRIYDVARREDAEETAILGDLVDQAMVDLEIIQNRESAYTGLPTGFRDLDDLTSGLQPGNLVVIAARPGVGKSSLAMNIARNVAVAGEPVARVLARDVAHRDRHAPALRRGARAVGPDPQQARRPRGLDPRRPGRRGACTTRRCTSSTPAT